MTKHPQQPSPSPQEPGLPCIQAPTRLGEKRCGFYRSSHQTLFILQGWEGLSSLLSQSLTETWTCHLGDQEETWRCDPRACTVWFSPPQSTAPIVDCHHSAARGQATQTRHWVSQNRVPGP